MMRELFDEYIRQSIKNWAVQQRPPASVRSRLLLRVNAKKRFRHADLGDIVKINSLEGWPLFFDYYGDYSRKPAYETYAWLIGRSLNPLQLFR